LEKTPGDHLVKILSQNGQAKLGQGLVQPRAQHLRGLTLHSCSGQPVPVFDHHPCVNIFPMRQKMYMNFLSIKKKK